MHSISSILPENNISFPKDLRFHTGLTFGEKMFFAEIKSLAEKNNTGTFPFSSRKLSQLFGVSHQTIINWIRKLEKLNMLEVGIDYNNTENRQFLKINHK